ncbi:hypothetical protein A3Q56_05597, partial [Intoshia linei]
KSSTSSKPKETFSLINYLKLFGHNIDLYESEGLIKISETRCIGQIEKRGKHLWRKKFLIFDYATKELQFLSNCDENNRISIKKCTYAFDLLEDVYAYKSFDEIDDSMPNYFRASDHKQISTMLISSRSSGKQCIFIIKLTNIILVLMTQTQSVMNLWMDIIRSAFE